MVRAGRDRPTSRKLPSKLELYNAGEALARRFGELNGIKFTIQAAGLLRGNCGEAYGDLITVSPVACAMPGNGGRNWNWPGNAIDRTPYGVVCHELGHVIDWWMGDGLLVYSRAVAKEAHWELPITSYAPDDKEWFAEMFRLFLTNPDLLRLIRPRTYAVLRGDFRPVVEEDWRTVLKDAPQRYVTVNENKIAKAARRG